MRWKVIALCLCTLMVGPTQAEDSLIVQQAWARESPPGVSNGVVYFVITNSGEADQLISITTTAAERAELHTHIQQDGVMQMRPVETIDVPPRGQIVLKPHGDHVILVGLKAPLKEDEKVELQLNFREHGELSNQAPIRKEPPGGP